MKLPIFLRIFLNEKLEGIKQFDESQIVIGKNPDVQLQLVDDSISPVHAMLEERDNGYYLSDLGSQSGVRLNGETILDSHIESGSQIQMGPFRLEFFIGLPKPTSLPVEGDTSLPPQGPPNLEGVSADGKSEEAKPPPRGQGELLSAEFEVNDSDEYTDSNVIDPEVTQTINSAPVIEDTIEVDSSMLSKAGFSPASEINDLTDYLKPGKGAVVEILVAWQERIIDVYHFDKERTVSIGANDKADIRVPVFGGGKFLFPLAKVGQVTTVLVTPDMKGELIQSDGTKVSFKNLFRQNRVVKAQQGYFINVQQGEMIRVGFQNDLMSVYIRYIEKGPKPIVAPILDLTTSEMTGVVLAVLVSVIFGLYMMVYTPKKVEDEARLEEPLRKAIVTFKALKPRPKIKQVAKIEPKKKVVKKVVDIMQQKAKKTPIAGVSKKKPKKGKTGGLRPIPKKTKAPKVKKIRTHINKGGGTNAKKANAPAKTKKIDVNTLGMLGTFGSKGRNKILKSSSTGTSKGLIGDASRASGTAGVRGRSGKNGFGSRLRQTTAGGKGKSSAGISDNVTEGMGIGKGGKVSGSIGKRGKANLQIADREAVFSGSIDKEAIRRVIREHRREIRSCYERQLQKEKDIYGKLVLEWDIEEKGRVTSARAAVNKVSTAVANCIIRKLKTWRFPEPPPDQIGRVRYPFIFTTQN